MGAGCRKAAGDKWSDIRDGDEKIFKLDGLFQETIKHRKFIVNTIEGQDEEAMETFKKLGLTALIIDKFYSTFRAIDGETWTIATFRYWHTSAYPAATTRATSSAPAQTVYVALQPS